MVSSTMLWRQLVRDREANAPWQRLRRNLLLLLQLLILAALVLALARPFLPIPSIVSGNVVVLLDGSASMQATDVGGSRFEAAKLEINRLINDLGGGQMTIIKVGQTPRVLAAATNDRGALRRALETAQPDSAAGDWPAAFALAAGAAQGFSEARIVVVSDGGLPRELPPLPAEIIYLPVGSSGENLAITALATRGTETGPQLFASIRNEGLSNQEAIFSLLLEGTLFDSQRISIPAGQSTNLTWQLPPGTSAIQATLSDNQNDFLDLDDTAWAIHEGGISNRALIVTEGNLFLEQAFSILPGIESFKAPPGSDLFEDQEQPFDLYVFDGTQVPKPPPAADMLVINPQATDIAASNADQLLSVTGAFSDTVATRLADSPLLRFVNWGNIHVRQAQSVSAPWARPLVTAPGGPLILVGEREGHRIAIITFDLRDSDLPLQIAFPILIANITEWLSPGRVFDALPGLQPGMPVTISPGTSTTAVIIRKPDGAIWVRETTGPGADESDEDEVIFSETDQLGLYQVTLRDSDGDRAAGAFAVNLFSPIEADIQPTETIPVPRVTSSSDDKRDVGQRELWPWLLSTAFIILLVEWWVHHRGTRLPNISLR